MFASAGKNTEDKKNVIWPILLITAIVFGIFLLFFPFAFKCYFDILGNTPFPLKVITLFISFCWFCALMTGFLNRLLFRDGISSSDLQIVRILGQSTLLMVITGLVLILLAGVKVLFL
jgi:vacuolar-type H+-ATPase subunit I/STV1